MTFLAVLGAILFTLVCLWPIRNLAGFLLMSDYGLIDTIKWNFFKERLWIEFILIPTAVILWWFVVGTHIQIGFV